MKNDKHGLLIVNGFMRSDKFDKLYSFLTAAADRRGMDMPICTNIDVMFDAATGEILSGRAAKSVEDADFILFWDKDVRLAYQLEAIGKRLFNPARAIELCDDKSLTHIALSGKLDMPKTVIAPLTFPRIGYTDTAFLSRIEDELGYPMVVKECFGSFGMQVYLVKNRQDMKDILKLTTGKPIIFQRFIKESFARDMRIYVVGDEPVAAMLRENEAGDFRANVALGGRTTAVKPNAEQAELAVRAAHELGLDFAGVDLLFGADEKPYLCEVNSNAHFMGIYESTGVNAAEAILRHIDEVIYGGGNVNHAE